ncbi:unnamed protein product, partial [Musa banksii]
MGVSFPVTSSSIACLLGLSCSGSLQRSLSSMPNTGHPSSIMKRVLSSLLPSPFAPPS